MTAPVSTTVNVRPAINWVVSRFPYLDPGSRTGGDRTAGGPGNAHARAPVSPGAVHGPDGQSAVGRRTDAGLGRGWIEDRMLAELDGRLLSQPHAPPSDHIGALRSAISQLEADAVQPDAVRALKDAVAGYGVVQQGRNALLGV